MEEQQSKLSEDHLKKLVNETINNSVAVDSSAYSAVKAGEWSQQISEGVVGKITGYLGYKYIADTLIMQKGTGMERSHTCFWDDSRDECVTIRWENNRIVCIVKVFSISTT